MLKEQLIHIWETHIAENYFTGLINNIHALRSNLFYYYQTFNYPITQAWIFPEFKFQSETGPIWDRIGRYQAEQQLLRLPTEFLITRENTVIGVISFNFSPSGYPDYREKVEQLCAWSKLAGKSIIYLKINPLSGKVDQETPYKVDEDILLIHTVIAKKGALAMDIRTLKKEKFSFPFPGNFLHLTGQIQENKVIFSYKIQEEL